MATVPRTGAETYLGDLGKVPEHRSDYDKARRRIDQVDAIVDALDDRRVALGLSKAELARRADLAPEAVRRLFSIEAPNPTIVTLVALADALDLQLAVASRPKVRSASKNRTRRG
jgi:DNA-binding phage protein